MIKPKKILELLDYKLLNVFCNNEYRRFIVLSRSRTGSNLLISLLNSHPHINATGEIFSRLNGRDYKKILSKVYSKKPRFVKASGFKIFYYHPLDDHSCGIWDELHSMNDLYVIHLKRKNVLRTLISRKIAADQDVWIVKPDQNPLSYKKQFCVNFTVEELKKGFRQTKNWEDSGENQFSNHPLLSIYYEDLASDRSTTFRKITNFLGVQYVQPKTDMKKQNQKCIRDTLANYENLKSKFAETEWASFFED